MFYDWLMASDIKFRTTTLIVQQRKFVVATLPVNTVFPIEVSVILSNWPDPISKDLSDIKMYTCK